MAIAYSGGTVVFPAEIGGWVVRSSASWTICTRFEKGNTWLSIDPCRNSDHIGWIARIASSRVWIQSHCNCRLTAHKHEIGLRSGEFGAHSGDIFQISNKVSRDWVLGDSWVHLGPNANNVHRTSRWPGSQIRS
jgi:hypothetical protein